MDISSVQKPSHKEWRQKIKKERRRRLRRKAAQDRDADAERLKLALENTAEYLNWMKEQEEKEKQEEIIEEQERIEKENEWLELELKAQEEWRALQERREKARQAQLEQEEMIRKEYDTKQEAIRKKVEEEKRRIEKELKKQEDLQTQINNYIDNGAKTPEFLRLITETQPGKGDICQFFTKTGSCRYGDACSRNHQKVSLSKIILVPGFYSHYSLENNYGDDNDGYLEYDSSELRQHFEEFYRDVVPELESFGKIRTLKFCKNSEPHLRGNLYVEYYTEREAARAVRKLKGRWFARRQIHCEFTGIQSWRTAICGMARCPKGRYCNFLHVFKNPNNEYYVRSPPRWANKRTEDGSRRSESNRHKGNWDDSVRGDVDHNSRNWRWDSPDPEPDERKGEGTRRRYPDDRYQGSKRNNYASSSRYRNYDDSRVRDYEDMSDEEYYSKHHRNSANSRSKRYDDEYRNGNGDSRHRRSDHGRYSRSYRSKTDRSKHRKNSHDRNRPREHRSSRKKEKRLRDLDSSDRDILKKSNAERNSESKWDDNSTLIKDKANSSSTDSSSSPASTTSSSSESSGKEEEVPKIGNLESEPEPKRQKLTIPEYYEWDTTESEDEDKK